MVDNYDISRNPSDLPKSQGVINVRPGASRQHFLNFDDLEGSPQDTSQRQLTAFSWLNTISEDTQEKELEEIFSTEIDESVYERYSIGSFLPQQWTKGPRDTLKTVIDNHCIKFHDKAMDLLNKHMNYEEALVNINKCLLLKPFHIPYYELRSEIYLNLCDFQSSIINLQKSILYTQTTTNSNSNSNSISNSRLSIPDQQQGRSISMPVTPAYREDRLTNNKIAFLRYLSGVSLFDQKLYLDALSIIANGANIFSTLPFQIYSILCLTALNKIDEASTLVTQLIEQYPQNADLLIIRARLYYKEKSKLPLCYYDVRDALTIDENHSLGQRMMLALEETAQQARDNAIRFSIDERLNDALALINLSIELYPIEAEFHLQRSIIYRKMKKYELATDECLLVFDKIAHDQEHKLYEQTQKQFVLIYNECSLRCLQTGFLDDGIELLNRAINQEKSFAELYINRGDCFLAKGQITFAIQDYEQALELAPENNEVKIRISNVYFNNAEHKYKDKRYQESANELTKAIDVNPSVGKYYVSRSRVKYLTEDIRGAQEDIIAAILINPLEEGCIDVLPRLFPESTLTQVLHSSLTRKVKEHLLKRNVRLAIV